MSAAFIVLLVVATGEADAQSTAVVAKTAQSALDERAIVVVREIDPDHLSNADAARLGDSLDASAVVVVSWRGGQKNATLRVRGNRRREWIERTVSFIDADPSVERSKTVGFEVASIIAERAEDASAVRSETVSAPATPNVPRPGATAPSRAALAIDLLGTGALGSGATGGGAEIAGRLWFLSRLAPRLAFGGRVGAVPEADANATTLRAAAGLAVRILRPSDDNLFGLGVRSDVLFLWHRLSRDDGLSAGTMTVGGWAGVVEASIRLLPPFAVVGGVGAEVAFGDLRVFVDNRQTNTIGLARGTAELGIRWEP